MLKKRSIVVAGHATSVSLEQEFWDALKDIATARGLSINQLTAQIDLGRGGNLSSAIRVFVLRDLQQRAIPARPAETETPPAGPDAGDV